MNYSIYDLEKKVRVKISENHFDLALYDIQSFVEKVIYIPQSAGNVISSPELDKLCQKIGAEIIKNHLETKSKEISSDLIVYVATQLYTSGGHTPVIEDLIKYQPDKTHLILMTDIFHNPHRKIIEKRFADYPVKFEWSPKNSLLEKMIWLQRRLLQLQPQRTFLFNHHQDSVAIAAAQPNLVPELYFFHHADHHLCLGVHLDHAIHVDAQSLGFNNCRHLLGVKNNIYWPLVVPDQGNRPTSLLFMTSGKMITCTSGSPMKFESPYLYKYVELLPEILQASKGNHIHIGKLSPSTLKNIYQGLNRYGIEKERLIHIPWVKSVWQTIIEQRVDLYLSSFPISGGRATIEIMGSGTPILMHENYRSQYLGQVYLAYPEAFYWKKPDELLEHLTKISSEWLEQQSGFARQHYERYHSPMFLKTELAKPSSEMKGLIPPMLPNYKRDELQVFLESRQNLTLFNLGKKCLIQLVFNNKYLMDVARKIRRHFSSSR